MKNDTRRSGSTFFLEKKKPSSSKEVSKNILNCIITKEMEIIDPGGRGIIIISIIIQYGFIVYK